MLGTLKKQQTTIRNDEKAITLITLVITIILLIILAGVAVNLALGQNGLFRKAKEAKLSMQEATVKEIIENIILQIQIEELEKGGNLTLKQVADMLQSKDNNIILEEYVEESKELKGTYNLNGEEYSFVINEKLEVKVTGKAQPKVISIQEITWQNGKPQVTLTSKEEGTIEYKDNNGNWQPFNNEIQLENNTELIVRVKKPTGETTNEEKIEIKDRIKPTEFEIEILNENIKAKAVTVTLKTQPQDNETGLKQGYTYIAEVNNNKIELTNITQTTYKIAGLEPETNYTIYVIAYDNAGNFRQSNKIEIKTKEITAPEINAPNIANTIREGNPLPFNWKELEEIAQIISDNYENELDDTKKITQNTNEFALTYEGEEYTIGVGDYTFINNKKVRILGFNHDNLTNPDAYGEERNNRKAGISFEYVDFITDTVSEMNNPDTTVGGWGACRLRSKLNGEEYNKIKDIINIKQVNKEYCAAYNNSAVSYANDYLWLLSFTEIWGVGGGSNKVCYEGSRYKFYGNINAIYNKSNNYLKKPSNAYNTSKNSSIWWIRTPSFYVKKFDRVSTVGTFAGTPNDGTTVSKYFVAPGFSI